MSVNPIRSARHSLQEFPAVPANPEPAEKLENAPDNPLAKRNISQGFSNPTVEAEMEDDVKNGLDALRICPTDYLGDISSENPRDAQISTLVSLMH